MRRRRVAGALAAALALAGALAGCRVNVDGAPCAEPGSTSDCPDGQACGNDSRCSARALACARCVPGWIECLDATSARRCDGAADPVCGRWVEESCAARDPACRIVADPRVTPDRFRRTPPADPEPQECRFGRLGDALAVAAERSPAEAAVEIDSGGAAFGAAEEWPAIVPSNVTVRAAQAGSPVIRAAGSPGAILRVEGALEDVEVEAEYATTTGVLVTAPGARLARVKVSGAARAALEIGVDADPAQAATVEVLGGSYAGSGVGIWIRAGRVRVAPDPSSATSAVASENPGSTIVTGNRDGIVVGGRSNRGLLLTTSSAIEAVLDRASIGANRGTGIIVAEIPSWTSSRVRVERCDVHENGRGVAPDPAPYGTAGSRKAGGVLVDLAAGSALEFKGNRLWSNAGDQLGFDSGSWSISAAPCGPHSNVFACLSASDCASGQQSECAVALAGGGTLDAAYNVWPKTPAFEFVVNVPGWGLVTGYDVYCNGAGEVPASPTCPP